jgi:hypothetical protein
MTVEAQEAMRKHDETQSRNRLANLESYLGSADPELEESYRRQIKQEKAKIQALQNRPRPVPVTIADINRVQHFLENLQDEWQKLSSSLRNRLLKLLVDRVEIVHGRGHIQATVIWKIGFRQKVDIEWEAGCSAKERRWTTEQDNLLRMLWSTSSREVLLAAFPERNWSGIISRAKTLGLMRKVRMYPPHWEPWTDNEDAKLRELYVRGTPVDAIAAELRRSTSAIAGRAHLLKINRPREARFLKRKVAWEVLNFYGLEAVSP